jgi:cytosine/adenosine deaminase-related metal-dependent hydrolase
VVHHDRWEPAFEHGFPLRVAPVRSVHSLGIEPELAARPPGDPGTPLCLHLAEGTTPEMADEIREAERLGLLNERLLAVHVVGADAGGVELLARRGAAVVWCPTSNRFLYGRTAPTELLARVDVLLGTDSLLSGDGTLLDELRAARATGWLDDARLTRSVGALAAERLHLPIPSLAPGSQADIVLLGKPLLEAACEDVLLVIVAGMPRVADPRFAELFDRAGVRAESLRVGKSDRLVAAPLGSVCERVLADWGEAGRIFEAARSQAPSAGA